MQDPTTSANPDNFRLTKGAIAIFTEISNALEESLESFEKCGISAEEQVEAAKAVPFIKDFTARNIITCIRSEKTKANPGQVKHDVADEPSEKGMSDSVAEDKQDAIITLGEANAAVVHRIFDVGLDSIKFNEINTVLQKVLNTFQGSSLSSDEQAEITEILQAFKNSIAQNIITHITRLEKAKANLDQVKHDVSNELNEAEIVKTMSDNTQHVLDLWTSHKS